MGLLPCASALRIGEADAWRSLSTPATRRAASVPTSRGRGSTRTDSSSPSACSRTLCYKTTGRREAIAPGTLYGDRVNELDVKIGENPEGRRTRTSAGIEVYNALNSNAVLTYSQNFTSVQSGPGAWLQPTSILTPRFVRLSAGFDF